MLIATLVGSAQCEQCEHIVNIDVGMKFHLDVSKRGNKFVGSGVFPSLVSNMVCGSSAPIVSARMMDWNALEYTDRCSWL